MHNDVTMVLHCSKLSEDVFGKIDGVTIDWFCASCHELVMSYINKSSGSLVKRY